MFTHTAKPPKFILRLAGQRPVMFLQRGLNDSWSAVERPPQGHRSKLKILICRWMQSFHTVQKTVFQL